MYFSAEYENVGYKNNSLERHLYLQEVKCNHLCPASYHLCPAYQETFPGRMKYRSCKGILHLIRLYSIALD